MANTAFATVTQYLASKPPAARRVLERVRAAIRKALPGAEEVISYQIPAYRVHGRIAIYFAGWQDHYSLYPVSDALVAALGSGVAAHQLSHKGTIRFPLSEAVPADLIARIAKLRADEVAARVATKKKGAKKKTAKKKAAKKAGKKKIAKKKKAATRR